MLDFRFKSLKLVSFVIGEEHGVSIVEEYDKQSFISYAFEMLPYPLPYGKNWTYDKYAN